MLAESAFGGAGAFPVRFPVVAMIASAGGLDALARVLAPLPAGLPAAILVALHQEPRRVNALAGVLARHTCLPVEVAESGAVMRPGLVLVVPPGRHLLVTSEARVGLIDSGELPPARPSGDLLLATLAVTCGPRALAVVLTGRGHDAQAGVRAVVHCGGTVFAQDEDSASFFAMPAAAIATNQVSQILAVDDIAAAIVAHTARVPALEPG
jgi:two-component system chemotaxis response regulator CheB